MGLHISEISFGQKLLTAAGLHRSASACLLCQSHFDACSAPAHLHIVSPTAERPCALFHMCVRNENNSSTAVATRARAHAKYKTPLCFYAVWVKTIGMMTTRGLKSGVSSIQQIHSHSTPFLSTSMHGSRGSAEETDLCEGDESHTMLLLSYNVHWTK